MSGTICLAIFFSRTKVGHGIVILVKHREVSDMCSDFNHILVDRRYKPFAQEPWLNGSLRAGTWVSIFRLVNCVLCVCVF